MSPHDLSNPFFLLISMTFTVMPFKFCFMLTSCTVVATDSVSWTDLSEASTWAVSSS